MLNTATQQKDIEIASPPTDTVSDLCFNPSADFLAASSWDNVTRIWEIQQTGASVPRAMIQHDAPPLCCSFSKDGTRLFASGADKIGRIMDMQTQQTITVGPPTGMHDAPIKCARWSDTPMQGMLITAGWDKVVKYWDLRSPPTAPLAALQLPERAYSMDAVGPLMVVATAERNVCMVNLANPGQILKTVASPLKWQTRTVACFHDARGFAIGSIEGRVGIHYVEDKDSHLNFSFKCHRDQPTSSSAIPNIYSVNAISFHPQYGTFSTAGADGGVNFWDKDSKQRLKQFPVVQGQITASGFNRDGKIFAYAIGYDWSKGHEHANGSVKPGIFMMAAKDEDVKPRPPKAKTGR